MIYMRNPFMALSEVDMTALSESFPYWTKREHFQCFRNWYCVTDRATTRHDLWQISARTSNVKFYQNQTNDSHIMRRPVIKFIMEIIIKFWHRLCFIFRYNFHLKHFSFCQIHREIQLRWLQKCTSAFI